MKWKEVNGEAVCDCDPICDNCERRFRCLDAGPANSILQSKRSAPRRFNTIAELQAINDRLTAENSRLREALEGILKLEVRAFGSLDFDAVTGIARAALKEGM